MITTNTTTFQYFQSANTSFKEIKQNFVVRLKEFELLRANLMDDEMQDSVQHFLILGRRGSGKSTLLKRIEGEVNENKKLNDKYISINFAEEQASIHRLFDLFEEIIRTLKCNFGFENLPDTDTIDIPDDYSEYSRELYHHIQSTLQSHSKKLLLLIDNIDKIFLGIKEDAQILREILLNYDDIKIIGGSTRMGEHFWKYDLPFYQFFRILRLESLTSEEIRNLLVSWSQRLEIKELEDFVKTKPGQLEAIRILTDGMPRTLQFFVDLLINRPQQNGYAYIQKIMDMVTPLYQKRLNSLLPIEQKIVLRLAFIWEAASIRDLVKPTKIESKLLSANLKKLSDNKIVDTISTGKKNHLYRLSERFFNMWLIVTQGNPMEKRKARWLTIFLENFYGQKEIKQIVKNHLEDLKSGRLKEDHLTLMTKALSQSKYTSFEERDLLIRQNLSLTSLNEDLKKTLPFTSFEISERIQHLIDEKNYNGALAEIKNIPNEIDGEKDFLHGRVLRLNGNFKESEKYYKKAIKKGNKKAYIDLAILYTIEEKFALAEKYLLKALELRVEESSYYLAVFYLMQKKYELAEKVYSKAVENEEEQDYSLLALIYDLSNELDLAEKYYLKAIEIGDNEALNTLAILYDYQKKHELAEKYFLQAIDKEINQAIYNIAKFYNRQKKFELAEKYFLKAIEKGESKAFFDLAYFYEKQEKYDLAEKYYLKAIEKGNNEALNNLAVIYDSQNKYELAEDFFLKAIDKEMINANYNIGRFYNIHKRFDLAEKYLLKAIEEGEHEAFFDLAYSYKKQEKNDLAEKYYLKAIEKGDNEALNSLGVLYVNQNKNDLAEEYYLKAIEKEVVGALNNLGELYRKQDKFRLAEEYLLTAIEKGIDVASFNIAILYSQEQNYDLAEKYYFKAYSLGIKEAMDNLAYLFYIELKNKEKLKLTLKKWSDSSINKRQYQMLSQIWNGEMHNVQKEVTSLTKEEGGIDEMFLTHLLVHHQKNLVWYLFNDAEVGKRLKNKFAPLYYATSQIIDNEESKLNLLKIPPEIEETVKDILAEIEKLRKEYYPNLNS